MKKNLPVFLLMIVLVMSACAPQLADAPVPVVKAQTQVPVVDSPTLASPTATYRSYTNSAFDLGFQFPVDWFGPEEYVSDGTLRVEIGSDKVYPYGEPPDQPSDVKNSYNVVIQYTKNDPNRSAGDSTFQALLSLKDGESLSGARSLLIRVRQIKLGRFEGFEYISTLPESAHTDHVYLRSVMLLDQQSHDRLTIMGQPINVEVGNGANWRDVYQTIDETNLTNFHEIVDSITVK